LSPSGATATGTILIVASDVSFLKTIDLPQGAKVNREFVELNYLHHSPYPNTDFCYARNGKRLLLWFFPAQETRYRFILPEGFLVWKSAGTVRNGFVYTKAASNKIKFFIFRDGVLAAQFVKTLFQNVDTEMEEVIGRVRNDFDQDDPEMVVLQDGFVQRGIESADLRDLMSFARFELEWRTSVEHVLDIVKWPLIVLLVAFIATTYTRYWSLKQEITGARAELEALRSGSESLKTSLKKHESRRQLWDGFRSSECAYPNPLDVMEEVAPVILENSGSLTQVRFADNRVSLGVLCPNMSAVIERLSQTGYFDHLTLSSAITRDDKSGQEKAVIEGLLKKVTKEPGSKNP
jgi:hypothetical protein